MAALAADSQLRESTERPVTMILGSSVLADTALANSDKSRFGVPALWDGNTADRIVDVLERWRSQQSGR